MEPPKNLKQLRGFIGAIINYRDMWSHRSHIIALLTKECGAHKQGKNGKRPREEKFKWTDEIQYAFEKTKALTGFRVRAHICAQANYKPPCELAILCDIVNQ